MNDTELRSRLQELADPPLAPRPSRVELEDRIARRTRRRRFAVAAAAVVVAAGAFAVSGWPWTRAPGYVQVDDPTPAQSDASQPSDKDPSEMTDAELAAELDRIIRSGGQIADGVRYFFGLGAELLGGQGDPRGVDTWWKQTGHQTPADLAADIDEYVADGLVRNEQLDRPGYLEGKDRTVALLREIAERLRGMPSPQRGPYTASAKGSRVPVPEMADHGMQGLDDVARLGDTVVAVGAVEIEERSPGGPWERPAAVISSDGGRTWEFVDLSAQGMGDWEITDVNAVGNQVALTGAVRSGDDSRPGAAISADGGRTWKPMGFPDGSSGMVLDITAAPGGSIVAVGKQADGAAGLWVSADRRSFTAVDAPETAAAVMAVTNGTPGLVAVVHRAGETGGPLIWRSQDGTSWDPVTPAGLPDDPVAVGALEWLDGRYVMIANGAGSTWVWRSGDALDWQRLDVEPVDDMVGARLFDVTADPQGRLVVVGGARERSDDRWPHAISWHEVPGTASLRIAGRTDVQGWITGIARSGAELLAVGIAFPPDADAGDGVVWELPRWQPVDR